MVLQLGIVLIPQVLIAAGVLFYTVRTHYRVDAVEKTDQEIEQRGQSLEAIET